VIRRKYFFLQERISRLVPINQHEQIENIKMDVSRWILVGMGVGFVVIKKK